MRSPRRLPWANQAELSELYEYLFSPSADNTSRIRGLSRMSIYISSPSCPAFIHLLHALVSASILPNPTNSAAEAQATRLCCAMAVVRFVNGMVDPLQTGPYARPISHIAASLQIPQSLIALRHRATHEDLPPLPLLQQAVQTCISYIREYSFLPMLASASSTDTYRLGPNKDIEGLVKRWKKVMKDRVKDLEVGEGREMEGLKKAFERFAGDGEGIVEVLCCEGGIVPVARRKRPSHSATSPSPSSLQIWQPLFINLSYSNRSFSAIFAEHIVSILVKPEPQETIMEQEQQKEVSSYRWTLGVWLLWLWRGEEEEGGLRLSGVDKKGLRKRLLGGLLVGDDVLRRTCMALEKIDKSFASMDDLKRFLPLAEEDGLKGFQEVEDGDVAMDDCDAKLDAMEEWLQKLEAKISKPVRHTDHFKEASVQDSVKQLEPESELELSGWRRLSAKEWRACPIGVWGNI